uniref:Putative basic tail protein n=1 Tax=Ixodes ricinus TaxID=34613 RepID=A0A0K8R913_IXORI
MPARALLYLFVGLFGDVMCNYYNPNECGQPDFPGPGYSRSCKRQCIDGDYQKQEENYQRGTFCFVTYADDNEALYYLGHCDNGECLPDNRGAGGRPPHQWDAEYHRCLDKTSAVPVKNCTYICEEHRPSHLPRAYFYGIYRNSTCTLANNETGICRSGFCHGKEHFPQIDHS